MAESPSMGVLQRAMSKRIGLSVPAPRNADPLDASEHPEHIQDESLDSSVTGSSVKAMSTFLCSIEVKCLRMIHLLLLCFENPEYQNIVPQINYQIMSMFVH
ncbi:unnamed protein product [Pylaiella littoralis]